MTTIEAKDQNSTVGSSEISIDPDAEVPSFVIESPDKQLVQRVQSDFNESATSVDDGLYDDFSIIASSSINDEVKGGPGNNDISPSGGVTWKAKTNFTADSPYYTTFCETEGNSLKTLADCLSTISSRTRTFCKTGTLMSDAARRLALACKLRNENDYNDSDEDSAASEKAERLFLKRRQAIGDEMAELLELVGQVRKLF